MAMDMITRRDVAGLYQAARSGDLAQVRSLLEGGADPDEVGGDDAETTLQAAIIGAADSEQRHELVSLLLSRGADPRQLDANGTGPLFFALLRQDLGVLELLLRQGADPNAEYGYAEKSVFWWARSDYLYETYGRELPEQPDDATWSDADALLEFLDELADRHGRRRPEGLRLLRRYGADMDHQ